MNGSVNKTRTKITAAFQGEHGAFSEEVILRYFWGNKENPITTLPCETFREVVESVEKGKAEYGILPVENSQEGNMDEACDHLLGFALYVVGEARLQIVHCLVGHPDASIGDIKKVYSHLQGLRQCRNFLHAYKLERIPTYNTAGSVKFISNRNNKSEAAIASKKAARIYGMKVLQESIEDNYYNYTRLFVVSRDNSLLHKPSILHPDVRNARTPMETSVAFITRHVPGALYECLGELAKREINLTKLESRPRKDRSWEYAFFADFEGSMEKKCMDAINGITKKASFVKLIGSYHSAIDIKHQEMNKRGIKDDK